MPSLPRSSRQKYKDVEPNLKIQDVDGLELVKKFSADMETMLRRKVEAVKVLRSCDLGGRELCPACHAKIPLK